VIDRKLALIAQHPEMGSKIGLSKPMPQKPQHSKLTAPPQQQHQQQQHQSGQEQASQTQYYSGHFGAQYRSVGVDMSDTKLFRQLLQALDIDFTVPTFILSECVLTYVTTLVADNIIQWCASTFDTAMFVLYEQIIPSDSFGHVMIQHFTKLSMESVILFPGIFRQSCSHFVYFGARFHL
jgi:hypothetical protein